MKWPILLWYLKFKKKVRSPIYVHLNNILSGMTTIRASNMQSILRKEYFRHNDYHTRAVGGFLFVNRWLGVRLG